MTVPAIHAFPVKRPGFIEQAHWLGDDDDLAFQVSYRNSDGDLQTKSFDTRNAGRAGEICVPSSNDVADMGPNARDILVAHVRMACMVAGIAVPGSKEFEDAILNGQLLAAGLQTAVGTVKVTSVALVDDSCMDLEFRQGTGPKRVYRVDHGELNSYQFVPSTQLGVIPGAVKKQFSTAVHNHPSVSLSEAAKDDISSYVLSLALWV